VKQLPRTNCALVVRTDFDHQQAWDRIRQLIVAPVPAYGDIFYANVEFLEEPEFRDLSPDDLLARVPPHYNHSFLIVVDHIATTHPDLAVLLIDLNTERGRQFRALPTEIQGIENNLSISNMDFFEFADNVDADGIFRGFPRS